MLEQQAAFNLLPNDRQKKRKRNTTWKIGRLAKRVSSREAQRFHTQYWKKIDSLTVDVPRLAVLQTAAIRSARYVQLIINIVDSVAEKLNEFLSQEKADLVSTAIRNHLSSYISTNTTSSLQRGKSVILFDNLWQSISAFLESSSIRAAGTETIRAANTESSFFDIADSLYLPTFTQSTDDKRTTWSRIQAISDYHDLIQSFVEDEFKSKKKKALCALLLGRKRRSRCLRLRAIKWHSNLQKAIENARNALDGSLGMLRSLCQALASMNENSVHLKKVDRRLIPFFKDTILSNIGQSLYRTNTSLEFRQLVENTQEFKPYINDEALHPARQYQLPVTFGKLLNENQGSSHVNQSHRMYEKGNDFDARSEWLRPQQIFT